MPDHYRSSALPPHDKAVPTETPGQAPLACLRAHTESEPLPTSLATGFSVPEPCTAAPPDSAADCGSGLISLDQGSLMGGAITSLDYAFPGLHAMQAAPMRRSSWLL
ncbi:hypothetical protein NDU88_000723 [Pleurodeles waltl]|uniref:Uncharacterized protein n=1 Tax=Pleurodeles waltl TaxID=8319 RepID=A0AAV7UQU5_PLEWA|nr:hypothetical protein NDU88_000723 [Pleurodeles waltl]